jgi:hypothetical protein
VFKEILESSVNDTTSLKNVIKIFKKHGWSKGTVKLETLENIYLPFKPMDKKADDAQAVIDGLKKHNIKYIRNPNSIEVVLNLKVDHV